MPGKSHRNRPRHDQLGRRGHGRRAAGRHRQPGRRAARRRRSSRFTKDGERLVGQVAKRQAVTNPENTVFSIKRFMGRKFDEVSAESVARAVHGRARAQNGDAWVEVARQEVLAARDLRDGPAEAEAGRRGLSRREGHRRGHHRAGVLQRRAAPGDEGRRQDRRPERAAHHQRADGGGAAYGLDKKKDETIAVYDFGGGTFDISVLEVGEGVVEVKATNGDTHLGGDDLDERIIEWLVAEFKKTDGIDLAQGPDGAPAPEGRRRRRPRSSCRRRWRPRSTCRSSRPTRPGPSTCR